MIINLIEWFFLNASYTCTIVVTEIGTLTASITSTGGKPLQRSFILSENDYNATISVILQAVELVSWNSGTDDQIVAMVNAYYEGSLTLDQIKSVWKVGNVRDISLKKMNAANGIDESHIAQTAQIRIIDFDHDELSTKNYEKDKALLTWQMVNCLNETGYMNKNNRNIGGWDKCDRRKWCNDTFYNALPSYLKEITKIVKKATMGGNSSTKIITSNDNCWLLSYREAGFSTTAEGYMQEGSPYSYYKSDSRRIKQSGEDKIYWWLRTPSASEVRLFYNVYTDGKSSTDNAANSDGLAVAGCL